MPYKTVIFTFFIVQQLFAQSTLQGHYQQAFAEQLQMLKGEKKVDFKRAVFPVSPHLRCWTCRE
jgi:hypothetical protein